MTNEIRNANLTVLVISGTWPPMHCGVGDYTAMLCEHLSRQSCNVHVITSQQARPDLRLGGSSLLEVHPIIHAWGLPSLARIARAVAELKPDVVNIQWPTAAYGRAVGVNLLPLYLRLRFPRLPVVTTLHELRYFHWWSRLRAYAYLLFSHAVIITNPAERETVMGMHPGAAAKLRQIPIASNLPSVPANDDRNERRRRLGFAPTDFVLGFFGFANAPKGLETLFAAFRELHDRYPDIRILLLSQLSEEEPYQRRLLGQMRQSGLDPLVVRPKYAEPGEAAAILAAADCAVLPFTDGVSVKRGSLMACLAQGLPVITTLPAPGEAGDFQDGTNMLLVPPRDPLTLANAILRLKQNPDLRAHLALGAWDLARRFSWEEIARAYLEIFRRVLPGRAA